MQKSIFDNPKFVKDQVIATASSSHDNEPIYAFDPSYNSRWTSTTISDWIQVCFRTKVLQLTKYVYKTEPNPDPDMHGSLKSWELFGSISGLSWESIQNITETEKTKEQSTVAEFEIETEKYYNCFRFNGKETWRKLDTTDLWTVDKFKFYGYLKQIPIFLQKTFSNKFNFSLLHLISIFIAL